jgi:putative hemolysin
MKNPSAVYCEALGYTYVTVTAQDGGMRGYCQFSPAEQVSAWKFLQGDAAQDRSYCAKQGLQYRRVTDPEVCRVFGLDTCMVCVLPDGKEKEVTALMNLSFEEGKCGDGRCTMAENAVSCPADCPAGGADGYCGNEGTDPDCGRTVSGSTGQKDHLPMATIGIIVLIIIVTAAYLVMRKNKDSGQKKP